MTENPPDIWSSLRALITRNVTGKSTKTVNSELS